MAAREYQIGLWLRWALLAATALLALKLASLCPGANLAGGLLWP